MTEPTFPKLDSNAAAFWDVRYEADFTPWDQGGVPQQARAFAARPAALGRAPGKTPRVLVPGCGSGYEVAAFAQAGWDVTGLDFSAAAVEHARANIGALADRIVHGDFFALAAAETYDGIYERTFLCALKPSMRQDYANKMSKLLPAGGKLFGFFYYDEKSGGPPFAISESELTALLNPSFERVEAAAVDDSLPLFRGKERWEVWQRR